MSAPSQTRLVFIGEPQTGKSTFLGAFWALVDSPVEASVHEASFNGDRSYIQRLADQVARAEELDRTPADSDEALEVQLAFDAEGVVDLLIPDTSGESLRILLERRIWPKALLAACEEASAILVFVHPERVRLPQRIAVGAPATFAAHAGAEDDHVDFYPPEGVAFHYQQHASTAAELVELFENLTELHRDRWPVRIGVIISAWDTVAGDPRPTPHQWLASHLPAALATLESNPDAFEFEAFGVSAQGGSLEARDELLAMGEICDRVHAEDRSGRRISLVEPIRWAIWGP